MQIPARIGAHGVRRLFKAKSRGSLFRLLQIAQQKQQGIFHGGFLLPEVFVKLLNGGALGVAVGNKPIVIIQGAQLRNHVDVANKGGILRPAPMRPIRSDAVLVGLGPGIHLRRQPRGVGFPCRVTGREVKEVFAHSPSFLGSQRR